MEGSYEAAFPCTSLEETDTSVVSPGAARTRVACARMSISASNMEKTWKLDLLVNINLLFLFRIDDKVARRVSTFRRRQENICATTASNLYGSSNVLTRKTAI